MNLFLRIMLQWESGLGLVEKVKFTLLTKCDNAVRYIYIKSKVCLWGKVVGNQELVGHMHYPRVWISDEMLYDLKTHPLCGTLNLLTSHLYLSSMPHNIFFLLQRKVQSTAEKTQATRKSILQKWTTSSGKAEVTSHWSLHPSPPSATAYPFFRMSCKLLAVSGLRYWHMCVCVCIKKEENAINIATL